MTERTKISSVIGKKIAAIRRDKVFRDNVIFYDQAGRPFLQMHVTDTDVFDGSGNWFQDDIVLKG